MKIYIKKVNQNMKWNTMWNYFKVDILRGVVSYQYFLATTLILSVLFAFILEQNLFMINTVFEIFEAVMYSGACIVILGCAMVAMANATCEDIEKRYITQQMLRGDVTSYTWARVVSTFLITALAVIIGIVLFAFILHMFYPWINERVAQVGAGSYFNLCLAESRLSILLEKGLFGWYFFLYAAHFGIFAGNLSLWSLYLSLHIRNRMLVLASPMLLFYFLDLWISKIFSNIPGIISVFSPSYNFMGNNIRSTVVMFLITIGNVILCGIVIVNKLKRYLYE